MAPDKIFLDLSSPLMTLPFLVRIGVAAMVGGLIGLQREYHGKAAGFRTHILVALAAALLVGMGLAFDMSSESVARVIQGIATGIGFIGAGTILKLEAEQQIRGLTTAASLWVTTAISIAYALGFFWLPTVATLGVLLTLVLLGKIEHRLDATRENRNKPI